MDETDHQLLAFIAEHRFVLPAHARAFVGVAPERRLRSLVAAGLLARDRSFGDPGCYFATRDGIRTVGRSYRARPISYGSYQHDVGVAWLWLAARGGTFGALREIISERSMRSRDRSPDRSGPPLGVRLGGYGASGAEQLHYPDLLLVTPNGKRIALELELTSKARARRERILTAYAANPRIDAVVYLVQNRAVGSAVRESARRIGISDLVHVHKVTGLARPSEPGRAIARASTRQRPGAAL